MMNIMFISNGFEECEAITTLDLLSRANIDVKTVSIEQSCHVVGSHNITIKTDLILQDFEKTYPLKSNVPELLILPGGPGHKRLLECEIVRSYIKACEESHSLIAAICAAPMILGQCDVLHGKCAVCYPGFEKHLSGATVVDASTVKSQNIITSRGVGTAIEFSLEIIKAIKGKKCSIEISYSILYNK